MCIRDSDWRSRLGDRHEIGNRLEIIDKKSIVDVYKRQGYGKKNNNDKTTII